MAQNVRVDRPKTKRGARFLKNRAPKIEENDKTTLFLKGSHTSATVMSAFTELLMMKRPLAVRLNQNNEERPFEETNDLSRMCRKHDTSLFVRVSHSKKRPNTLTFGRLFNSEVLDMYEVEVSEFTSMRQFQGLKVAYGTKPLLLFHGPNFEGYGDLYHFRNFLVDFFRGPKAKQVMLTSLEHVLQFREINDHCFEIRSYRATLKESSGGVTVQSLQEIGPRMKWTLRRCALASHDKWKRAIFVPHETVQAQKHQKNVSMDPLGNQMARVYVPPQELNKLPSKQMKSLKRARQQFNKAADESGELDTSVEPHKKMRNVHTTDS